MPWPHRHGHIGVPRPGAVGPAPCVVGRSIHFRGRTVLDAETAARRPTPPPTKCCAQPPPPNTTQPQSPARATIPPVTPEEVSDKLSAFSSVPTAPNPSASKTCGCSRAVPRGRHGRSMRRLTTPTAAAKRSLSSPALTHAKARTRCRARRSTASSKRQRAPVSPSRACTCWATIRSACRSSHGPRRMRDYRRRILRDTHTLRRKAWPRSSARSRIHSPHPPQHAGLERLPRPEPGLSPPRRSPSLRANIPRDRTGTAPPSSLAFRWLKRTSRRPRALAVHGDTAWATSSSGRRRPLRP